MCNIINCKNGNTFTCSRCGLVKYCSKLCQRKDWVIHKRICYANPVDRIKGFISLSKENYEHKKSNNEVIYLSFMKINLSWSTFENFMDGKYHQVSPLGGSKAKCAICYKLVDYKGPLNDRRKEISNNIEYFLCNYCFNTGATLCPESYQEFNVCTRSRYNAAGLL